MRIQEIFSLSKRPTTLHVMQKYDMKIESYGSGISVQFKDDAGKDRYEEFGTEFTNLDDLVDRVMEEITYRKT